MGSLSPAEEAELLARYRPWLRTTAHNLLQGRPRDHAQDLAQEGWIEMWKAAGERNALGKSAPLDYWLKHRALQRMHQMLRDWYGPQKQRQHTWVDDVTSVVELPTVMGQIELAYHHGEIMAAINELTAKQREYVVLRFWRDWGQAELAAHFGYKPGGLWSQAKPRLREALAHLAPEVETAR